MIELKVTVKQQTVTRIESYVQGFLMLLSLTGVSYGFYLAWRPLGFLVGGILLGGIGLLMNKISAAKESR